MPKSTHLWNQASYKNIILEAMVYTQRPVGEKKKYINEALAHI